MAGAGSRPALRAARPGQPSVRYPGGLREQVSKAFACRWCGTRATAAEGQAVEPWRVRRVRSIAKFGPTTPVCSLRLQAIPACYDEPDRRAETAQPRFCPSWAQVLPTQARQKETVVLRPVLGQV